MKRITLLVILSVFVISQIDAKKIPTGWIQGRFGTYRIGRENDVPYCPSSSQSGGYHHGDNCKMVKICGADMDEILDIYNSGEWCNSLKEYENPEDIPNKTFKCGKNLLNDEESDVTCEFTEAKSAVDEEDDAMKFDDDQYDAPNASKAQPQCINDAFRYDVSPMVEAHLGVCGKNI